MRRRQALCVGGGEIDHQTDDGSLNKVATADA
jgi:hypothetical protein